jgi:uncharacterized Fe-S radical SAM superfamily protein PflX
VSGVAKSGDFWAVLDHAKHPGGFVNMTRAEVRERTKNLRRQASGDGGELYFDLAGLIVVEAYPPRNGNGLGACMSCHVNCDVEELKDGGGVCKSCAKLSPSARWAP